MCRDQMTWSPTWRSDCWLGSLIWFVWRCRFQTHLLFQTELLKCTNFTPIVGLHIKVLTNPLAVVEQKDLEKSKEIVTSIIQDIIALYRDLSVADNVHRDLSSILHLMITRFTACPVLGWSCHEKNGRLLSPHHWQPRAGWSVDSRLSDRNVSHPYSSRFFPVSKLELRHGGNHVRDTRFSCCKVELNWMSPALNEVLATTMMTMNQYNGKGNSRVPRRAKTVSEHKSYSPVVPKGNYPD